jgi:ATP-dependent DNA ligase
MTLPLEPPLPPMLAKLGDELPSGDWQYEPKLDGFRCLVFRDGDRVELQSRHGNPLARYFPEVVAALPPGRYVVDGELVPVDGDFPALMQRLHPAASRVQLLAARAPARLVAFDLLALHDAALLDTELAERRRALETVGVPVGEASTSPTDAAAWLERHEGVVAKQLRSRYEPGRRGWVKVKRRRTADCVVAGFRLRAERPLPSSLLLGLYDSDGRLEHVGVAASFGVRQAQALLAELQPHVAPLGGHPWEHGFLVGGGSVGRLRGAAGRWVPGMTMDWVPVAPVLVAEVTYDQVDERRFRHPARFVRWRRDRDPRSCTYAQLS